MPVRTGVAAQLATAVAEPTRLRLLAALADGPRSATALAALLGTDDAAVARHLRPLEHLGLVDSSDSSGTRTYAVLWDPCLSDDAWGRLPIPTRRTTAAVTLTQWQASVAAAVDDGGFDRRDAHLTRTSLDLDEAGWRRAATILGDAVDAVARLGDQPTGDPTVRATAMMLLFENEFGAPAEAPADEQAQFAQAEGLERAFDLAESVQDAVSREVTPWQELIALADQLRVVARAAMMAESRGLAVPPAP